MTEQAQPRPDGAADSPVPDSGAPVAAASATPVPEIGAQEAAVAHPERSPYPSMAPATAPPGWPRPSGGPPPGYGTWPQSAGAPYAGPAPPYAAPASPYGAAPASPYGAAPASPYGAAPPGYFGGPPPAGYAGVGPLPAGGAQPGYGRPPAPPPRDSWRGPSRIEPVPGTSYALGYLAVPSTTSGMAVGSLVAGLASLLVSLLVACFGFSGATEGWGAWVAGAFAVLAAVLGAAGLGLGLAALRQIKRGTAAADRRTGRGLAISGLVCGAAGAGLTALIFVLVLVIQIS